MPCYTPLKGYVKVGGGFTGDASKGNGTKMEVACGQCLGCRLDHSRMWAMRIIHEAQLYAISSGSSFITLTYDRSNVPSDWSLCLRDFQLFMKVFRRDLADRGLPRIRFFMCGEYGVICRHGFATEEGVIRYGEILPLCGDGDGCNVGRPHFHAIIFNVMFPNKFEVGRGHDDIIYYSDDSLTSAWQKGFVSMGDVTMESAGYVARYAVKKVGGLVLDSYIVPDGESDIISNLRFNYVTFNDQHGFSDVRPEFSTQSNRPGIGADWFDKYQSDVFPSDEVPVPGQGVFKKVPGYYDLLFDRENPELMEKVKEVRQAWLKLHLGEVSPERLMDKYKVKLRQIGNLKRIL